MDQGDPRGPIAVPDCPGGPSLFATHANDRAPTLPELRSFPGYPTETLRGAIDDAWSRSLSK